MLEGLVRIEAHRHGPIAESIFFSPLQRDSGVGHSSETSGVGHSRGTSSVGRSSGTSGVERSRELWF